MTAPLIDIVEFRRLGYLQEANRLFFHPLGLALIVDVREDGSEVLSGIVDQRHEPEGVTFAEPSLASRPALDKARFVAAIRQQHEAARVTLLGSVVQQIPGLAQPQQTQHEVRTFNAELPPRDQPAGEPESIQRANELDRLAPKKAKR